MKIFRTLIFTSVCAIALSGCSGSSSGGKVDLDGSAWVLVSLDGEQPIEDRQPTLAFEGGQVSGNASCNHYGAGYEIEDDAITFSGLYNTEMACMEKEGVMQQEQMYLGILRNAQRFELGENLLTIFTDTEQTLTFERQ